MSDIGFESALEDVVDANNQKKSEEFVSVVQQHCMPTANASSMCKANSNNKCNPTSGPAGPRHARLAAMSAVCGIGGD